MSTTARIAISLPRPLLRRVDELTLRLNETRSGFIRRSLERTIHGHESLPPSRRRHLTFSYRTSASSSPSCTRTVRGSPVATCATRRTTFPVSPCRTMA